MPVRGRVHLREDGQGPGGALWEFPRLGFGGTSARSRRAALSPRPPRGPCCTFQEFFAANQNTLSRDHLATALRAIIMGGPAKTRRTPMLVGPSNTGKSTLVSPFVQLFGFRSVFHKPALKSAFALRNILKDKRFLYWDDYRPVQYAQATVEVGTVLSLFNGLPFEVQMPQNVHDGTLGAASQATSACFPWRPAGLLRPQP